MKTVRKVTAALIACMIICWGCFIYNDYAKAETVDTVVLSTHVYSPIAKEMGVRSGNFCADPQHPEDPRCMLTSFAFRAAEEAMSTTDATVNEVKITTKERDLHLTNNDLEDFIIGKANVEFKNHDTQQPVDNIKAVSVSNLDILAHLQPEEGYIELTVQLGLNTSGGELATAFVETKVYLQKAADEEKDDKKEDEKKEEEKKDNDNKDNSGSGDEVEIDESEDAGSEDTGVDKKKEEEKKAKAKAEKEMMDKATAKISAKEREKEENIAVKAGEDGEATDGPDPLGVGLIALAAALAALFGWLIRSDLKVMRWYKQKKALRGK